MRFPPTSTGPAVARRFHPPSPAARPGPFATPVRSSAAGVLERRIPPRLAPLHDDPRVSNAPAAGAPLGPKTALGELSACRDAVAIADVVRRHPGTAVLLVKQTAPQLLARIASNKALDADTKLAHLQSLVEFVGRKGGKADFVTQRGVADLKKIVGNFNKSPDARPHHVARLLVALQELPKAVTSQHAQAMMKHAHGPGRVPPNFGIFEEMHGQNHLAGQQGGVYRPELRAYVYPNGDTFAVRTIRQDPLPPPGRFNALQVAMPLAAPARRQPHR